LTVEEKQLLVSEGIPKEEDFKKLVTDSEGKNSTYEANLELYKMAITEQGKQSV